MSSCLTIIVTFARTEIKEWFTVRAKELESMNYTEKSIKRIILAAIR